MLPSLFSGESNAQPSAVLALADGTVFKGYSIGAAGHTVAELVFSTAMTGYQEILTNPSSKGQIITLSYPHIGNTGVNPQDSESDCVQAAGLIIKNCPVRLSNFRSTQSLPDYLADQGVVAIAGIDTRKLIRILREKGAQAGCIWVGDDAEAALKLAQSWQAQPLDTNYPSAEAKAWTQGSWQLGQGFVEKTPDQHLPHVVVYDLGAPLNTLRLLADTGCRISVAPAQSSLEQLLALQPDGIVLSAGPGNPADYTQAIELINALLAKNIPLLGLGLGHQLLGVAAGAQSIKLKNAHHGTNHPIQHQQGGQMYISSQNQAYALDPASLPDHIQPTYVSLFDGSLQGFSLTTSPAMAYQGIPLSTPGPRDITAIFDQFIHLITTK